MTGRTRLIFGAILATSFLFGLPAEAQEDRIPVVAREAWSWFENWDRKVNDFLSPDKIFPDSRSGARDWLDSANNRGRQAINSTTTREVRQLGAKVAQENKDIFLEIWTETRNFSVFVWDKIKLAGKSVFRELFGFLLDRLG